MYVPPSPLQRPHPCLQGLHQFSQGSAPRGCLLRPGLCCPQRAPALAIAMSLFTLYVVNKSGGLIYTKDLQPSSAKLSGNEVMMAAPDFKGGGMTFEAAVLFSDASGFTALTERLAKHSGGAAPEAQDPQTLSAL